MKYAPILIPTLCRDDKFVRCVESLRKNSWAKYTAVYIALDYPAKKSHWEGYKKICEYLEQDFPEFAEMHVVKRTHNYGSCENVNDLRNTIFETWDRYIYTDDDMEFSPNFLEYIDKTMELYDNNPDVIAVCGYSYPLKWDVSEKSNIFESTIACFMWGTGFWRDKYLPIRQTLRDGVLRREYATGNRRFWKEKLIDARYIDFIGLGVSDEKGLLDDSSDVSISTYMELYDKYAIIPVLSKARNYGFDGTGLYCQDIKEYSFNSSQYNYIMQEIDENSSFEPRPDISKHEKINKKMWNEFDCRPNMVERVITTEGKHLFRIFFGDKTYQKLKMLVKC